MGLVTNDEKFEQRMMKSLIMAKNICDSSKLGPRSDLDDEEFFKLAMEYCDRCKIKRLCKLINVDDIDMDDLKAYESHGDNGQQLAHTQLDRERFWRND